jgi:diguanylate cyclase (GGDEF)-like protein
MSRPLESAYQSVDVPAASRARVLPFSADTIAAEKFVSDSTVLRISNALQSSLYVKDVIHAFAAETGRLIRDITVSYRNRGRDIFLTDGERGLHRMSYELNLLGNSLGEITFMRGCVISEKNQALLEAVLCALIYPLRNALLYEQALTQALKDPLTGINNRASMDSYLRHQVLLAERHKNLLSIIIIDVDLFKSINDTYGHVVGDSVLRTISDTIVKCTRNSDVVFRYGGEEFVVILTNAESDGAVLLAERIRQAVRQLVVDELAARFVITVSAGVAQKADGDSPEELIQRADKALYRAKDEGRDRVCMAPHQD